MAQLDITNPAVYLDGIPHARFAEMRAASGLTWQPYEQNGFWAVTRHADVSRVSRDIDIYSSGIGHTNLWDLEADALEARRSLIDSDPPDHRRLRKLVNKAFARSAVAQWEAMTREIASALIDSYLETGGGDWVRAVSAPLPIRVILSVLGVPVEDGEYLVELSNYLVEGTGDRPTLAQDAYGNTTPLRLLPFGSPASHALYTYGERLGAERAANPTGDLISQLVAVRGKSDGLSDAEFRNLFHVLIFAGNETTRTAMSHGAIAFADHPGEWQRLVNDHSLLDSAVEEVLRWSTPVLHMRRTAARDAELAGTAITAGDKVVMWYASANFDGSVFPDPHVFDVGRHVNPQQSFGGIGPHFCLGAFLARMEIKVLLEELLARDVRPVRIGEPERVASNFVNGIASVDMSLAS